MTNDREGGGGWDLVLGGFIPGGGGGFDPTLQKQGGFIPGGGFVPGGIWSYALYIYTITSYCIIIIYKYNSFLLQFFGFLSIQVTYVSCMH